MKVVSPEPRVSRSPAADRPRQVAGFAPVRIVLAKGSNTSAGRRRLAGAVCAAYPEAEVVEALDTAHNRLRLASVAPLERHGEGKQTLVLAEHRSAVRLSAERGNTCPNYWHFSPYGFCPYGCAYCYLAGTQGVWFSPTVKVFVNLPEILAEVDAVARRLCEPAAFYLGKLQDGLALDPLTGYSRQMVPFFAGHPLARLTLLTKSADVGNLLGLDHRGHSALSWTLSPQAVVEAFEPNTPPLEARLRAMDACTEAGYPVRAVVMPILPVPDWETVYGEFLRNLLRRVRLSRLTLGSICSYPQAVRLTEQKLGRDNLISARLAAGRPVGADRRRRFPRELRRRIYEHLLRIIRGVDAEIDVALCLEEPEMLDGLGMNAGPGRCNCVW